MEDVKHAKTVKAEREKPAQLTLPRCGGGGALPLAPSVPSVPVGPGAEPPSPVGDWTALAGAAAQPGMPQPAAPAAALPRWPFAPCSVTVATLPPGTHQAASATGPEGQLL